MHLCILSAQTFSLLNGNMLNLDHVSFFDIWLEMIVGYDSFPSLVLQIEPRET